ncbi:MAG: hypothetical protein A3H96_08775 [Acidobacteria bacterium RIFCSPLOWO2_02_FULL_67_36]|nr:MAG: hypothetical protein A3H96_08775 [Acidobacteria bacterium RIFCSPLOWO2_02_FULL_67_36]OFW21070.1 MAG: hypothetical protein A3G21_14205 [Acidobacteria bacterium RIFCSPLOWO2_12_FULL_66_21]
MRLLSYNIRHGGSGREAPLAAVVGACRPDVVIFQEATKPGVIERLASDCGMAQWASRPGESLAFMSRERVAHYEWHRPRLSRHAFLEIVPAGDPLRVFGVHLAAVYAAWTEQRRTMELRALLGAIAHHQAGFHVLMGDFNTLAPGELLDLRTLPHRLRALVWLSGGRVRWRTIKIVLDAGYVDGFRLRHPNVPGLTFPSWAPHVRLDYAFVPTGFADRLRTCKVVTHAQVKDASDHHPILAEVGGL